VDFTGKIALITGGTRGIGAAIATILESYGAQLIITGTQQSQIDKLNSAAPANREYWCADVRDRASLDAFCTRIEGLKKLDVCINNAGTNRNNPIDAIQNEDIDAILDINLRAPLIICRSVSRVMKRHQSGRIVNIASIWGVISKPGRSVYSASKFGIVGITKALALDLAENGILVNAVSPGFTMTELLTNTLSSEEQDSLAAQVPLKRIAKPEEIAQAVAFLSSDTNSYITGQNIVADGGFTSA